MNSEGNRENLKFSPGELFKNGNVRVEDLDFEMAQKIANQIGLTFLPEENRNGNVCMAESSEVLPEFRGICTGRDLLNYVIAIVYSDENSEKLKNREKFYSMRIPFPQDATTFWSQVEVGSKLKKNIFET